MTVNIAGKSVSYAALAAAVGGLVAVVATALPWAAFHGEALTGLDEGLLGGKLVALLGVALVAVVGAGVAGIKIPQVGIVLAALGAAILVVLVLIYFTEILSDVSFKDLMDLGASIGIGVIAEAAAGIAAIVGGLMIHLKKA